VQQFQNPLKHARPSLDADALFGRPTSSGDVVTTPMAHA
jgi:hypothetical protein